MYRTLNQIAEEAMRTPAGRRVVVAGGQEPHVLEAVEEARRAGLVKAPLLVGDREKMARALTEAQLPEKEYRLFPVEDDVACGWRAVELVQAGEADFIMKGLINTQELLRPVVNQEKGLYTGRFISHVALDEIPPLGDSPRRLIVVTDAGMHPYPDLEEKRGILGNAVELLRRLGWERPSAAFLCGAELVAPKIPETVEADALAALCRSGEIPHCDGVGPISFDLAMSREIAAIKGYPCPYSGAFDILLAPNMAAGNLMQKAMLLMGGAKMAGLLLGARVPVVLTSRGSSAEEKFASLAIAVKMLEGEGW
ncbi:MAG: phosphate acyltransferase [Bacillota bacterium]|nr:phosphate acyltransferase [Bacillota bacterium]